VPTEPQKDKLGTVGPFSKKNKKITFWNESVFKSKKKSEFSGTIRTDQKLFVLAEELSILIKK